MLNIYVEVKLLNSDACKSAEECSSLLFLEGSKRNFILKLESTQIKSCFQLKNKATGKRFQDIFVFIAALGRSLHRVETYYRIIIQCHLGKHWR